MAASQMSVAQPWPSVLHPIARRLLGVLVVVLVTAIGD
jgi:hypothetical protein